MLRIAAGALALLVIASCASAADGDATYPARPIRIVVPVPAGGGTDTVGRILAQHMQQKWGQPVVIDNRSGAGGNIGAEVVSRSDPDGYTFLLTPPSALVVNATLYKHISFDPSKFKPVTITTNSANILAVPMSSPFKTAREFIDFAKGNPGKLTYASQGVGATSHLSSAWLAQVLGTEFVHVPFAGAAPALNDVVGGHTDFIIADIGSVLPLVTGEKLRALAVLTSDPLPLMPNTPTMVSQGLAGFTSSTWFAIAAPAGTPDRIIDKVAAETHDIVYLPEVKSRLDSLGVTPVGSTPAEAAGVIRDETARWRKVIETAHITVD